MNYVVVVHYPSPPPTIIVDSSTWTGRAAEHAEHVGQHIVQQKDRNIYYGPFDIYNNALKACIYTYKHQDADFSIHPYDPEIHKELESPIEFYKSSWEG